MSCFDFPFPTLLCRTSSGVVAKREEGGCASLQEAVRVAKSSSLLGILAHAEPLVKAPMLVQAVRESGLLLASYGAVGNDRLILERAGIDAVVEGGRILVRQSDNGDRDYL